SRGAGCLRPRTAETGGVRCRPRIPPAQSSCRGLAAAMRVGYCLAVLVAVFMPAGLFAALAETDREKLLRYGEQLAQECVSSHRKAGKDVGIPGIVAMSEPEFVNAMMLYKTGRRKNKVMVSVSASLDDTQIQALAVYFASLGRP